MPRADEPRVMVRLSAGLAHELETWSELHGVTVPAIIRAAVGLAGERAAITAAQAKALKSSGSRRKMPRAAPSRSRPGGVASISEPVDRAGVFRAVEERRRALRG